MRAALLSPILGSLQLTLALRSGPFVNGWTRSATRGSVPWSTAGRGVGMATVPFPKVPVTLLSGFLGAGKTTVLQEILENKEGLRVGVIVNDLASVNVDGKLVRDYSSSDDTVQMVELQNGCVCCSVSDELFSSVYQLLDVASMRGVPYDHIIIEASGVAEPKAVRRTFQDAEAYRMPVMDLVYLDTMVTVVDAASFLSAYSNSERMVQHPELAMQPEAVVAALSAGMDGGMYRAVVDLLVEQVECADVLLVNKVDQVSGEQLDAVLGITKALNPLAKMTTCTYGKAPVSSTLGAIGGGGVADFGVIDDHKELVEALSHSSTDGSNVDDNCKDPDCSDMSHDHSHSHSHATAAEGAEAESCSDPSCSDPSHSHSHSHSHTHSEEGGDVCEDATCNDPTHDHSHSHGHASTSTAEDRFGISSFVYRRRRPFHPQRFSSLAIGVGKGSTLMLRVIAFNSASLGSRHGSCVTGAGVPGLANLLRSKGFCWFAQSDRAAMYWSQAGAHCDLQCLGAWWAAVPKENWPPGQEAAITEDFQGDFQDRRQELVFIGYNVAGGKTQHEIEAALDDCLLTDEELKLYCDSREKVCAHPCNQPLPLLTTPACILFFLSLFIQVGGLEEAFPSNLYITMAG
ncbi:unnamed protein product [Chrysoparadoxa australica]